MHISVRACVCIRRALMGPANDYWPADLGGTINARPPHVGHAVTCMTVYSLYDAMRWVYSFLESRIQKRRLSSTMSINGALLDDREEMDFDDGRKERV